MRERLRADPPPCTHPRLLLVGLGQPEAHRPELAEDLGRDFRMFRPLPSRVRSAAWRRRWKARSRWSPARPAARDAGSRWSSAPRGATVYVTGRTSGAAALGDEPAGDDRGDRGAGRRGRRARDRGPGRPPRARRGARARGAHRREQGALARARERHLGRHHDGVGQDGLGVRPGVRAAHAAPGGRHARDHQPLRAAAAHQDAGRPGRRGDRRDRRVQRDQLPGLVLLRPGQGGGEPHGVRAGARVGAARRDGRVAHPGLAALRGDARRVTASPRRTGATRPRSSRTSRSPRARRSSAAPSPRSPRIPTWRAGTASRCPAAQLAKVYGFTDLDGSQPDAWRYLVEVQDAGKPADTTGYR